jgi:hypothetical protein
MNVKVPSEFEDILSVHERVSSFVRVILSEARPESKRCFLRNQTNPKLRFDTNDFISPLGICRYVMAVTSAQSNQMHPFFTRFVPPKNNTLQWLNGLYLGPDGFQEVLQKNFNEAARLVRTRMADSGKMKKTHTEWVEKALSELGVQKCIQTISTIAELESYIVKRPDGAQTAIVENLLDVISELEAFVQHCSNGVLCKSIERKVKKVKSVVEGLQQTTFFQPVQQQQPVEQQVREENVVPMKEYERLCGLLEKHKIDYVDVPSDSLQELQTYIQKQEALQQTFVRVLFADDSPDGKKFEAENHIERIQKNLDTAQRKQFDFHEFLRAQQDFMAEQFGPAVERVRAAYVEQLHSANIGGGTFDVVVVAHIQQKLPYKTRTQVFNDSDVGPFIGQSNTLLKTWLACVNNQNCETFLRIEEVRRCVGQVWESRDVKKVGIGCFLYFAIPWGSLSAFEPLRRAWMDFVLFSRNANLASLARATHNLGYKLVAC